VVLGSRGAFIENADRRVGATEGKEARRKVNSKVVLESERNLKRQEGEKKQKQAARKRENI